jgi:hypothetical protein
VLEVGVLAVCAAAVVAFAAVVVVLAAALVVAVVVLVVGVVPVAGLVLVLAGAAAVVAVLFRARAGSWPEINSIVISSQVATNSASALATTRRRIPEMRAIRAWRTAIPRARRSDGEGVIVSSSW